MLLQKVLKILSFELKNCIAMIAKLTKTPNLKLLFSFSNLSAILNLCISNFYGQWTPKARQIKESNFHHKHDIFVCEHAG